MPNPRVIKGSALAGAIAIIVFGSVVGKSVHDDLTAGNGQVLGKWETMNVILGFGSLVGILSGMILYCKVAHERDHGQGYLPEYGGFQERLGFKLLEKLFIAIGAIAGLVLAVVHHSMNDVLMNAGYPQWQADSMEALDFFGAATSCGLTAAVLYKGVSCLLPCERTVEAAPEVRYPSYRGASLSQTFIEIPEEEIWN